MNSIVSAQFIFIKVFKNQYDFLETFLYGTVDNFFWQLSYDAIIVCKWLGYHILIVDNSKISLVFVLLKAENIAYLCIFSTY